MITDQVAEKHNQRFGKLDGKNGRLPVNSFQKSGLSSGRSSNSSTNSFQKLAGNFHETCL